VAVFKDEAKSSLKLTSLSDLLETDLLFFKGIIQNGKAYLLSQSGSLGDAAESTDKPVGDEL
jgi:hypothetical protein